MHDATVLEDEVDDTYIHTTFTDRQRQARTHTHTHTLMGTPAPKNTCTRTHNKCIITIKILNRNNTET